MKRELCAAALLALLIAGASVNLVCLDRLVGALEAELDTAEALAESGDFPGAVEALDRAIAHWVAADGYTHIFIRHPEIDACSDAFFECRQLLAEQNAEGFPSAFDKLRYHLDSIDEMERPRLGSIL